MISSLIAFYDEGTPTREVVGNNVTYEYRKDISMMVDIGENIRYYGADPDNYVMFNGEQWRIIGVFNDIDAGTGKKETRVKIARATPLSTYYAWNSEGINEWEYSSLSLYLNEDYLNSLTNQSLIASVFWDLRVAPSYSLYADGFYEMERVTGEIGSSNNSEGLWFGSVGLMYPSDYMYAGDLVACQELGVSCKSWLRFSSLPQWMMMLYNYSGGNSSLISSYSGNIYIMNVTSLSSVRPVLYLEPKVSIISGSGKPGDEFILG